MQNAIVAMAHHRENNVSHSPLDGLVSRLRGHSPLNAEDEAILRSLPAHPAELQMHGDLRKSGETARHACLVTTGLIARFAQGRQPSDHDTLFER